MKNLIVKVVLFMQMTISAITGADLNSAQNIFENSVEAEAQKAREDNVEIKEVYDDFTIDYDVYWIDDLVCDVDCIYIINGTKFGTIEKVVIDRKGRMISDQIHTYYVNDNVYDTEKEYIEAFHEIIDNWE